MKIACIIHSLDGGGAERVMAGLASRLARRNHEVTLVTLDDGGQDRHTLDPLVARRNLDLMGQSHGLIEKISRTRERIAAVRCAVNEWLPDVVLSFCDRTNILALQALASGKLPVVIAERSDPSRQNLGPFWEFQRRRTYRHAARIIALTDTAATTLSPLSQNRVVVIPSAVDSPPCYSDRAAAAVRQTIVGVGRLEPEKGFDRLLRAFAAATAETIDWQLRILGEGSQRAALQRMSADLGIERRVEFPGWLTPIWDEIAAATFFALSSRHEGFPSALLEAMAVGVPSLAVDCDSGPRAILSHEVDGLLAEDSERGLQLAIERMIAAPDERERWGVAGRAVVDRFGWDAMVDAYERVLREAAQP